MNDVLLIEGEPEKLLNAGAALGLEPTPGSFNEQLVADLTPGDSKLAEITLAPSSLLSGKTLEQIGFRAQYGISVLAVRSGGESTLSPDGRNAAQFRRRAARAGAAKEPRPAAPG
jgi:K+/H+ antiporter YhaU regulatory subunit KhtT